VSEGSTVALSGLASYDPDSDPLTYSWAQTGGPAVALLGADTATPNFTAPLLPGGVSVGLVLTFRLDVSDGLLIAGDEVRVVVEQVNHPPVADAGAPQTVNAGSIVTLDGTGSTDPDSDPLFYQWQQFAGPPVSLSGGGTSTPTFTAPPVTGPTDLTFRLVTTDGQLASDEARVVITVVRPNDPPLCGLARPTLDTLWPPTHKMIQVGISGVTDSNNDAVSIRIAGVTQDEPTEGLGDGDTAPDAVLQGGTAMLRAERLGQGNGRVYQIRFTATDALGAACHGSVLVIVPKSMKPGESVIDDGQLYDSTAP
jgi:PKD domain